MTARIALKKIKEHHATLYQKQYTDAEIRNCVAQTAKIHGITITEVYKYLLESQNLQSQNLHLPKEVRDLIFNLVESDDKQYKKLLEVNKSVNKKHKVNKSKHFNQLWTLIYKTAVLYKKWNWEFILKNPNTTMKQIKEWVSNKTPGSSHSHMLGMGNGQYYRSIALNPNLSDVTLIEKYMRLGDWFDISYGSKFAIDYADQFLDSKGNLGELSKNPYLTMRIINSYQNYEWEWDYVSANKGITMQDVINNPGKPWNYMMMSENPNLTIEFVDANLDKHWVWLKVSANSNISLEAIEERMDNEEYLWSSQGLSENPNLTMAFVNKYPKGVRLHAIHSWNWWKISSNPGITMQDIENNPQYKWEKNFIIANPNFTVEYAEKHPEMMNDFVAFQSFSMNPNLTADYVMEHIDKGWNWNLISENKFTKNPVLRYVKS